MSVYRTIGPLAFKVIIKKYILYGSKMVFLIRERRPTSEDFSAFRLHNAIVSLKWYAWYDMICVQTVFYVF